MPENLTVGATCRPNFSAAGRRRRTLIARVGAVSAVASLGILIAVDAAWPFRLLVGLPAAVAIVSGLEVRRNTCVMHAATGTLEGEDFRRRRVDEEFAAASRRVASGIWRDGAIASVLIALASAATDLLR